jgi:hypothetical protein
MWGTSLCSRIFQCRLFTAAVITEYCMHEAMYAHGMRLIEGAALQHSRPLATLQLQDEGSQSLPTLSINVQGIGTYSSPDLTHTALV